MYIAVFKICICSHSRVQNLLGSSSYNGFLSRSNSTAEMALVKRASTFPLTLAKFMSTALTTTVSL